MAQLVKGPTLDLRLGHDLTVGEFYPHVGICTDGVGACLGFYSVPPSPAPPPHVVAHTRPLSLKINKTQKKKKKAVTEYTFMFPSCISPCIT